MKTKEENKEKKKVKPTLIRLIAEIISDRDVGRAMSRQPTYYFKRKQVGKFETRK